MTTENWKERTGKAVQNAILGPRLPERWFLAKGAAYDPSTGRFTTRDPIGQGGGLNVYAYCGNNPVGGVDPSGLERILIVVGSRDAGKGNSKRFVELAGRLANWLRGKGHEVTVVYEPSVDQLAKSLKGVTSAIFIGHGNAEGLYVGNGTSFDYELGPKVFQVCLRGKKLNKLVLFACSAMNSRNKDKWKKCAKSIWGSDDISQHSQDLLQQWNEWLEGETHPSLPKNERGVPFPAIWPKR